VRLAAQSIIASDLGDQLLPCTECSVRNIFAPIVVDQVTLSVLEIVIWRD
jgi:hypothetical protein